MDNPTVDSIYECNAAAFGDGKLGVERQNKLSNQKILVVGGEIMSDLVLGGLYGLGVKNIMYCDNSEYVTRNNKGFLFEKNHNYLSKRKSSVVKNALNIINSDLNIQAIHSRFKSPYALDFEPDVIIDATNDPISKKNCLEYVINHNRNKTSFISLSSSDYDSSISTLWKEDSNNFDLEKLMLSDYANKKQVGSTSGIVSAFALEEIRKNIFSYNDDDNKISSNEILKYNMFSSSRTGSSDTSSNYFYYFGDKKILVAGCGALGNQIEIYLADKAPALVDFIDFDTAELKNLNRQTELRGCLGRKKCDVLAERLKENNPSIEVNSIYGKLGSKNSKNSDIPIIDEELLLSKNYDVILGCFDNKLARKYLSDFSEHNGISYIDGGSSPTQGQVSLYVPNQTDPISKQINLENASEVRMSCANSVNPSVVMSNMVVAGIMVDEMVHVFNKDFGEKYANGIVKYSIFDNQRLYVNNNV